ncbi:hypothetical protein JW948_06560 [bacterium]|nr:hypothetical protein [bacterium]
MNRTLIGFGLLWFFIWGIFGLFLRIQQPRFSGKITNTDPFTGSVISQDMIRTWKTAEKIQTDAVILALIAILIGTGAPMYCASERQRRIIDASLITGIICSGLFGILKIHPAAVTGDVLVLSAILAVFIGLVRESEA